MEGQTTTHVIADKLEKYKNAIKKMDLLINSKENGRNKIVNPGSVCCQYLSLFVHLVLSISTSRTRIHT